MKWNSTKYFFPAIIGLFFGYVASIFNEWKNCVQYFNYGRFIESLWLILPFIGTVLLITIFTDVTVFGWEKTKKNIEFNLSKLRDLVAKEKKWDFSSEIFFEKDRLYLKVTNTPFRVFPIKNTAIIRYENIDSPSKKDSYSYFDYKIKKVDYDTKKIVLEEEVLSYESGLFEVFSWNKKNQKFFLSRNEIIPEPNFLWKESDFLLLKDGLEFYDMTFPTGKYKFKIKILGKSFIGENFVQTFSFSIECLKKGISLLQ